VDRAVDFGNLDSQVVDRGVHFNSNGICKVLRSTLSGSGVIG